MHSAKILVLGGVGGGEGVSIGRGTKTSHGPLLSIARLLQLNNNPIITP